MVKEGRGGSSKKGEQKSIRYCKFASPCTITVEGTGFDRRGLLPVSRPVRGELRNQTRFTSVTCAGDVLVQFHLC